MRMLNLVNEQGEVIGEASRDEIHQKGLLHAEIHVWFFTPDGNLIFQHRGENKDTFPDLLDATVGGHVEIGQTSIEAAVEETKEETGQVISKDDLVPVSVDITKGTDKYGMTNHARRETFAYRFTGDIENLKLEGNDKSVGFEVYSVDELFDLREEEKKKFIPFLTEEPFLSIYRKIKEIIG